MNRKLRNYWFCLCSLFSSPALANDVMFSATAAPVVGIALLAWLVIGAFLHVINRQLVFIGPGTIVVIVLSIGFFFHLELALMFWLVYLALLVVYFAFPRQSILHETRRVNLFFHGTTLVIVIMGGAIAKYLYWSNQGGFARWSEWMRVIYPPFLIGFGLITVMVALWLYFKTFSKLEMQKFQIEDKEMKGLNKRE